MAMTLDAIYNKYQPILCGCSKGLYTSTKGCIDPFPYCMMSSGRSILASSLLYSIMLCFIIIFHKDNLSER